MYIHQDITTYVCTYVRMCMYIRTYITDCIALHPSDLLLKLATTIFVRIEAGARI